MVSVTNRIISAWNTAGLPDSVVSTNTLNAFKNRIDRLAKPGSSVQFNWS